jgi:hypothetical protein
MQFAIPLMEPHGLPLPSTFSAIEDEANNMVNKNNPAIFFILNPPLEFSSMSEHIYSLYIV